MSARPFLHPQIAGSVYRRSSDKQVLARYVPYRQGLERLSMRWTYTMKVRVAERAHVALGEVMSTRRRSTASCQK